MTEITKDEFLGAIALIKNYLSQEDSKLAEEEQSLDALKKTALPFTGINIRDFCDQIELSSIARNGLMRHARDFFEGGFYEPAYRIQEISIDRLKSTRNVGKVSVFEIEEALKNYGIYLKNR